MKKAFDQTVRDIKREVNKKVLKVPGIEQKILDATSNEPWGPHGSHLADIAQATRNSFEYQLIMSIIWKRLNDTGKNWRHVYKALTVLEYLVAHGSERVIDEIREHAYQISTLSDFQYIDSKGRDQGNNVRRKSQNLVALVNDKERIQEVREKAFANKDKYRSTFAAGRPGSYGDRYDDDRFGSRDDDRNGYGRDRDGGYRDEDRYGRDKDRYGRDFDEHYRRDGSRDDDYRGRSRDDSYKYGARSRSADRERDHSFDDDDRYSSRGGGRLDDPPQDGRPLERKFSEPNFHAPPSYEEAVKDTSSHVPDQRDGKSPAAPADVPKPVALNDPRVSSHSESTNVGSVNVQAPVLSPDAFDEFDPRGPLQVAPAASKAAEVDLFGSLSTEESINHLALVPVSSESSFLESDMPTNSGPASGFVASSSTSSLFNKPNENPFEDAPFRATLQGGSFGSQPQENIPSASPFQTSFGSLGNSQLPAVQSIRSGVGLDLEESLHGITYAPSFPDDQTSSVTPSYTSQSALAPQSNGAGLEGIFSQGGQPNVFSSQLAPPAVPVRTQTAPPGFLAQSSLTAPVVPYAQTNYYGQPAVAPVNHHTATGLIANATSGNLLQRGLSLQTAYSSTGTTFSSQGASSTSASTTKPPSLPKDKFETKSGVWADTINRGLVNLNISGPKTNPLADIGVDFDAINRKEQREKKATTTTTVSTVSMGKAMGSGMGRANATSLAPPPNPMMGTGIGMAGNLGMGMGMTGGGMGMGGYAGGTNQPGSMGIGMNMGVGMNSMGMRPNANMPPGPGIGYNPMGMGGFGSQPYGGGYR